MTHSDIATCTQEGKSMLNEILDFNFLCRNLYLNLVKNVIKKRLWVIFLIKINHE